MEKEEKVSFPGCVQSQLYVPVPYPVLPDDSDVLYSCDIPAIPCELPLFSVRKDLKTGNYDNLSGS